MTLGESQIIIIIITGESQMPVIHFLMEFRLRPLAGVGEDWVSLVIPYNPATSTQSYLLRGLTPGTKHFSLFSALNSLAS